MVNFRVVNDAAPLKQSIENDAILRWQNFRVVNDAAPLKRAIEHGVERAYRYTSASSTTRPH